VTGTGAFADEAVQQAAERGLRSVTGEQPRTVEPLDRGNRKRTAVVRFDDRGPVVLQLCDERTWLRTESTLLTQIRERTDVPVPPVLAAGVTNGIAYMVTSYVPGDDLHTRFVGLDSEHQCRLARSFGVYLGMLHERFRFDGYGTIRVDDGALVTGAGNWSEWLTGYGQQAVERLPSEFDPVRGMLRSVLAGSDRGRPPARLFPWDFRPGNAIVADGAVAAILDWETPKAAAAALPAAKAEYLVARWYVDDPAPLRRAFVEGYGTVREYPDVRPAHRVAAIADTAVDSNGVVTNPGYPELDREAAVSFHREALADLV
jgi:hypothetical protein